MNPNARRTSTALVAAVCGANTALATAADAAAAAPPQRKVTPGAFGGCRRAGVLPPATLARHRALAAR